MTSPEFPFDGDHLALDFLNTLPRRAEGARDLLASPADVAAWLARAGILTEGDALRLQASPPVARVLEIEARGLRAALAELVEAFARGTHLPEPAVWALNRVLEARRTRVVVDVVGANATLREDAEARIPLGLLTPVAAAAAELLASRDRTRLRRCAATDCGLWFYDTSRGGKRRWCSMARCGNRAKVAAHYRRARAGA